MCINRVHSISGLARLYKTAHQTECHGAGTEQTRLNITDSKRERCEREIWRERDGEMEIERAGREMEIESESSRDR